MSDDAKQQAKLNALLREEKDLNDQIQRQIDTGNGQSDKAIQLQQNKNTLVGKQNALLGITVKNLSSVASAMGDIQAEADDVQKLYRGMADTLKTVGSNSKIIAGHESSIRLSMIGALTTTKKQEKISSQIEKLQSLGSTSSQKYLVSKQAVMSVLNQSAALYSDIASVQETAVLNELNRGSALMESLNTSSAQARLEDAQLALMAGKLSMSEQDLALAQASVNEAKMNVAHLKAQADVLDYQISQRDALADAILGPFQSLKSTIESFPGGKFLSGALGLDVFDSQMKEIIQISLQDGMKDGVAAGMKGFKEMTASTRVFGMSLKAAMGPLIAVGVIVAALMLFKEMEKTTLEISKNQGVSATNAQKQHQAAMAAQSSSSNQLANTEEILASQAALNDAFGNTTSASAETAMNVSNLATAFGIAVNDAAAVQAQFENMGQSSEDAFQSSALAANLADAAGVAPGKVMKDIATNSKKASKYLGGSVKELTKAAVEAARLGLSLSDMVDISDGLLDIESSVTAEFEASAMLGRTINMDKARTLALEGDIAGAAAATLEQAGSLAEINAMEPLQRKAIAKAAGLTVSQLQEAAKKQEMLNNMTADQKKRYEEAGKALEGATLSPEDIVAQQEAALATKQMGAQFDKIKNTLLKAIMPVVQAITKIFTSILAPVLDVIGGVFKGMMFVLTPVFMVIQGIAKVISTIAPVLKVIAGLFGVIYGIKALIWAGDKLSLAREKMKALFGTKELATKTAINVAKGLGLISDKQSALALGRQSMIGKGNLAQANTMNLYKNQGLLKQIQTNAINMKDAIVSKGQLLTQYLFGSAKARALGTTIKESAIKMKDWVMDKATLAIQATRNFLKNTELGTTIAIGAQKAMQFIKDVASNALAFGRAALEQGILAVQFAINAAKTIGNVIAAGAIAPLMAAAGAAIAAAIPAIFTGLGMVPFGLGIPLAFAAVAGLVGLVASMSKGDDVMSKPSGGSGYGSRTLFGPEGAISFNNKDTIVAGTNLFANDMVQAPKGAIKMNDGMIGPGGGDMPDPPETMVVDYSADAIKKMAVAVGIGTMASGLVLKAIPQMTFELNPLTFSVMGGMMALLGGALGAGASMLGGGSDSGGSEGSATLDTVAEKLDQLITAITGNSGGKSSGPVQIVIGNKVIEEIGSQVNVNRSYNIMHGSAGEEG